MYFKSYLFRLISILTLLLLLNKVYSQDFTIAELLSFQKLNKNSLELYLTNKGYKLDEYTSQNNDNERKSFKKFDFLDRIHFSIFTFDVNNSAQITSISYEFNRNIIYHNLFTQIKNLKFKLLEHAEGDFGTDIYVYLKDKIEIRAQEQPEGHNSSCENCTYYYINLYFK